MIDLADGNPTAWAGAFAAGAAGAALGGAGAWGACASSADPAETTAARPTAARPDDTIRPCRSIEMRMFESSVERGAGAILSREKGKGKREKEKGKESYFFVMLVTTPSM
jgi:hypothetical protein